MPMLRVLLARCHAMLAAGDSDSASAPQRQPAARTPPQEGYRAVGAVAVRAGSRRVEYVDDRPSRYAMRSTSAQPDIFAR